LFKALNLRKFFTDCFEILTQRTVFSLGGTLVTNHQLLNSRLYYIYCILYLYYADVTPATGKNMLPLKHSAKATHAILHMSIDTVVEADEVVHYPTEF
jgi:hypothetical protein